MNELDFGRGLDETVVKTGLRELCPGIHFDMGTNLGMWHPSQSTRQGIYYQGRHICSMDRCVLPEYKVWDEGQGFQEISMTDIERYDDSHVAFMEILPTDPYYEAALAAAEAKDDHYHVDPRGKVFRYSAYRLAGVKRQVIRVGWRHTFERLIQAKLPGITRESLMEKFGVDLPVYPFGVPETVIEELAED